MINVRPRSTQVFLIALPLVRWGLERLVQTAHPELEVVGVAGTLAEGIPLLERQTADVVVLVAEGVTTAEHLAQLCGKTRAKILMVTSSQDLAWLDQAVMVGVRGVVGTSEAPPTLLKAIEKVHDGEFWIDRGATSRIFMEMARKKASGANDPDKTKIATLTTRERQTIAALASDASASGKVIASRLCISEHTLRNHLTSIYTKLELSNRVDLYAYATRHSLHELR